MEELIERIKKYCEKYAGEVSAHEDDFCADDFAGGNVDDAWYGGMEDGAANVCNNVLSIIENSKA